MHGLVGKQKSPEHAAKLRANLARMTAGRVARTTCSRGHELVQGPKQRWCPTCHTDTSLKRRLGISFDEKKRMYESQGGLCGVCLKPLPEDVSKCDTDHNHRTGTVRELLHRRCNLFVGVAESNPELLDCIRQYTERWKND